MPRRHPRPEAAPAAAVTADKARHRARVYQRGAHVYKRGKKYYARGGVLGREGISLHTSDPVVADRNLRVELERRDRGGARTATPAESPITECIKAYLAAPHGQTRRTKGSMRVRLDATVVLLADLGAKHPSEITPSVVDRWIKERSAKVSRRTLNRDLRAMRVCLRWAHERGMCNEVPAMKRELREPSRSEPRDIPSPDELAVIVAEVERQHRVAALAIRALAACGCRIEELRRLTPADVHDSEVWIRPEAGAADTAEPGKGYGTRRVPLSESALDDVRAWLDGRGDYTASEGWLRRYLSAAAKVLSVPVVRPHDMRRLFVTTCYRAGVSLDVIARWVGHKSPRTTEGYLGRFRADAMESAPVVLARRATVAESADSLQIHTAPKGSPAPSVGVRQRAGRAKKTA